MKTRLLLIALIVVLSSALIFLIAFWEPLPPATIAAAPPHARRRPRPSQREATSPSREPQGPVSLADYRGKVVLLYFGYTYCPDVCPTSLALIAQALSGLEATEQQQVQAFFISVDPRRDSAERLQEYAPFFHPTLIGLSGTPQEIARVAAQYGASYQAQPPNAQGQYSVDHSSATYLIDTQGKLALSLPHASTPAQILAAIRQHLAAPLPPGEANSIPLDQLPTGELPPCVCIPPCIILAAALTALRCPCPPWPVKPI
jgi:protein SCO1/2